MAVARLAKVGKLVACWLRCNTNQHQQTFLANLEATLPSAGLLAPLPILCHVRLELYLVKLKEYRRAEQCDLVRSALDMASQLERAKLAESYQSRLALVSHRRDFELAYQAN